MDFYKKVIANIKKIQNDKNLTQAAMAEYMGVSASQYSRIISESGYFVQLKHLSNLARALEISEIDILTYPEHYVLQEANNSHEAIIQIKLNNADLDRLISSVSADNINIFKNCKR